PRTYHLKQGLEQNRTLVELDALVRPMGDLGLYLAGRIDPAALDGDFEGRTALLSPFDRLVHDRGGGVSTARVNSPGSTPARARSVPSGAQIDDSAAVSSKPPPVGPAKLAKAT